jgi:hypothetical protein
MRIFARFTFIFNLGFIAAMLMQITDSSLLPAGAIGEAGIHSIVVFILTLYFLATLINFIFCTLGLYILIFNKNNRIPKWLLYFNLVMMGWQLIYLFII